MPLVQLSHFTFEYHPSMVCIADHEAQRLVFINKQYDEIHLVVEVQEGQLVFHPRWNIKIITDENRPKTYILEVNYEDNPFVKLS